MSSRWLALFAVGLTACAPAAVESPRHIFFSSTKDALVRDCPLPLIDSLAPCRLAATRNRRELQEIAATNGKLGVVGDTLTFAVKAAGAMAVRISGGVELLLSRLPNSEIFAGSIHVPRAARAVISYRVFTDTTRGIPLRYEFRGESAAPRPPRAQRLAGKLRVDTLPARQLNEKREVISYLPPGSSAQSRHPVVYLPDGVLVKQLAPMLDTLIASRQLQPVVLVGVRAAANEMRAHEYVLAFDDDTARFRAHEQFFVEDVVQWAEANLPVANSREARILWGASNGGAFVVAMGVRHPERYARVFASSPVFQKVPAPHKGADLPAFHIAAGTFEGTSRDYAFGLVQVLRDLNARSEFHELVGGHDELVWMEWLLRMLRCVQTGRD